MFHFLIFFSMFHFQIFANLYVSFDNICQYSIIFHLIIFANIPLFHILFFQYFFHVLTLFLKFCQSDDRGKGPEHGKGVDRGKGHVPSIASTKNDEYISDEEIFDSIDPLQTIELSIRKANREFLNLVIVGPETAQDFKRIAELCIKIENYGVIHVI
jgi:hypothetical protein